MWAAVKGERGPWRAGSKRLAQMMGRAAGVGIQLLGHNCAPCACALVSNNKALPGMSLSSSPSPFTSLHCARKERFLSLRAWLAGASVPELQCTLLFLAQVRASYWMTVVSLQATSTSKPRGPLHSASACFCGPVADVDCGQRSFWCIVNPSWHSSRSRLESSAVNLIIQEPLWGLIEPLR